MVVHQDVNMQHLMQNYDHTSPVQNNKLLLQDLNSEYT